MSRVPEIRIRTQHDAPVNPHGDYVLHWMVAHRRTRWSYSLDRSVEWARELGKPLLVFEALRAGYPWASDRIHTFVLQGMADNAARLARAGVRYLPYLEPEPGAGRGLLAALAERAAVVVSDDFPCFFLPRMLASATAQIPVRFELVDTNGLWPMRATDKVFARAFDFRRFLQRELRPWLGERPRADPFPRAGLPGTARIPAAITRRWPAAKLDDPAHLVRDLPIDHTVGVGALAGGTGAAEQQLRAFLDSKLDRYESRNDPSLDVASGLSPYLHFGYVSAHQVFADVTRRDGWTPDAIAAKATGQSRGWWGAHDAVESFLDELITWRELGYNMCAHRDDYDRYESLPEWARTTLAEHEGDARSHVYPLATFEAAETHDELWNAAQRQLVREGRMHNYLRMLWGKKILEWTANPRDALAIMIELNNKYALDGRNPNSYSGIFWVLGRYDRAWGPERPVYGKIRYMSSENTARKVRVGPYLERYAA